MASWRPRRIGNNLAQDRHRNDASLTVLIVIGVKRFLICRLNCVGNNELQLFEEPLVFSKDNPANVDVAGFTSASESGMDNLTRNVGPTSALSILGRSAAGQVIHAIVADLFTRARSACAIVRKTSAASLVGAPITIGTPRSPPARISGTSGTCPSSAVPSD